MSVLLLINGAPGSGKSTQASLVAAHRDMALALDIDLIKHSLGRWDADPYSSGLQARRLTVAMIRQHLLDGHDVILGQYLARDDFILELEAVAQTCGARFIETILHLDSEVLADRIAQRHREPDRAEHTINNALVRPDDAPRLADSMTDLRHTRPNAVVIDATGEAEQTAQALNHLCQEM